MDRAARLVKAARRERLRVINPEVPPEAAYGDVGYYLPPLEQLDRDHMSWRWRLLKISAGIVAIFALVVIVMALGLWYLGALGFGF